MRTSRLGVQATTFGISLRLLCERSGIEVPLILGDILRWLAAHALAQPDVFAQVARSAATSHLKCAIDSGASLAEVVEGTHPAVVGSLLKRWLEELPDPLLNWDQQVELLSACKDEGCIESRIASLNDAVALVDPISLGTLKPLLLFLQQYCFRQRRFDQQLLQVAVAFAPILFPAALAAGPAELRLAEETVATLVSNALHVFNPTLAANVPVVTPQALSEAAAEVTAMESSSPRHDQAPTRSPQQGAHHSGLAAGGVASPSGKSDGAVGSSPRCSPAQRRIQQAGLQASAFEHADDIALLSIDQRLRQHQPQPQQGEQEHQQGKGARAASASAHLPSVQVAPESQPILAERRDDGVDGAPADAPCAASTSEERSYEPYLSDTTFLACLDVMVGSCVASALFSSSPSLELDSLSEGGGGGVSAAAQWHTAREVGLEEAGRADGAEADEHEHCGSLAPSACSSELLSSQGGGSAPSSSGGKSSSGGGSAASSHHGEDLEFHCFGKPISGVAVEANNHQHHQHVMQPHAQQQQEPLRHSGSAKQACESSEREAQPYSPRAVLIPPPKADDASVVVSGPGGHGAAPGPKAPSASASAALAELAHREVSEGSVICIISASPASSGVEGAGEGGLVLPGGLIVGGAAGNAVRAKQLASGKTPSPRGGPSGVEVQHKQHRPHSQQQQQHREQEQQAGTGPSGPKRAADGGAAEVLDALAEHAARLGASAGLAGRPGATGEMPLRRMTMGGMESTCGSGCGASLQSQQQHHQRPSSTNGSQPHSTANNRGGGTGSSAAHLSSAPSSSNRAVTHSAQSHPSNATVSAVTAALHGHRGGGSGCSGLPAPSPSSSSAHTASGHIAELGVAGHLRVSLTSAHTLAVRELATPEAQAHRIHIRSMTVPALQAEKERLKRQLKDVAAAYEALAGQALVPALKEPLRPVYVRYHKIKALLNNGDRAAAGSVQPAGGSAGTVSSRRQALRS